jgi:hypothetical protein
MAKRIEVEVIKKDIKAGCRSSCKWCPVALALKRTFKTVFVDADSFFLTIGEQAYMTPLAVLEFMDKFDRGQIVESFTFYLTEATNG